MERVNCNPPLSIWSGLKHDPAGTLAGLRRLMTGGADGEHSLRLDEEGHQLFENAKRVRYMPGNLADLGAQFPHRPEALQVRASVEQEEKNWAALLVTADALRQRCPWLVMGYRYGGTALRALKRYDEAEELALAAIRRFPRCSGAYSDFALSAALRGDHDEAMRRWAVAKRRFPDHMWTHLLHARSLYEVKQFAEADVLLSEAVSLWPEEWHAWLWYAEVPERQGHWLEAAERWKELTRVQPGKSDPYCRAARAFRLAGDLDSAAALIVEGGYLFPQDATITAERATIAAAGGPIEIYEQVRRG